MRSPSRTTRTFCVQPLVLQISLRERGPPVQRRRERADDLGHRRRIGGLGGCGTARSMSAARYVIRDARCCFEYQATAALDRLA